MNALIIAIDGPSGAGKGTVARAIAATLGYSHVDSGAMYRAVAWKALREQIPLEDEEAVVRVAERARIEVTDACVSVDDEVVTREIRTPAIDRAAASVARLPQVRAILVARQRALGTAGGIVMEGRDIGTVVFPQADVKIYLDASAQERARRRASDPAHSGGPTALSDVATLLTERDHLDSTRLSSPLYAAPDAIVVDTTEHTIEQVVADVMKVIEARRRGENGSLKPEA